MILFARACILKTADGTHAFDRSRALRTIRDWPLPVTIDGESALDTLRTSTSFEEELCSSKDWTPAAAEEITYAYRRFLYLKTLTGETLSPPSWIDEAWHLHMTFPADYAAFQKRVGHRIAHRQHLTGAERRLAWDRGRALWRAEFDEEPRPSIWPKRPARWRPYAGILIWVLGIATAAFVSDSGWSLTNEGKETGLLPAIVFGFGFLGLGVMFFEPGPATRFRSDCG